MNGDKEFIQAMIDLIRRFTPKQQLWSRWECISANPLVFAGFGGELRAGGTDGMPLTLTTTAQRYEWKTGDKAAAILNPGSVLILDQVEAEQEAM